jgi:hypothetical protein
MRLRWWITLVGIVILAPPLAASAASALRDAARTSKAVPFVTLSSGGSTKHPRRNRLYLARSLAATYAWSQWLSADARKALRRVDFDRYGVVAAFHLQKSTGLRITRIARASNRLGLWLAVPKPSQPDPTALTSAAYHVVKVKRRYLRNVSRLAVSGVTVYSPPLR